MTINVTVRNGNLEQAMRVLKRKVQKEGLIKELRERQFYKKPSEIKQEKKKEAIKNWRNNLLIAERLIKSSVKPIKKNREAPVSIICILLSTSGYNK